MGCRGQDARSVLVRVVLTDGRLAVDESATAPGRGAWLHPDGGCLSHATKRHAFGRAFRTAGFEASGLIEHPAFRDNHGP
ncbi:MAG TPA: YlxR family protein [Demequina sp.]|nr:YlxR family protein [Demequina sp.]